MKKKILSLTLVVCLLAIAVVGGTLAYFTDKTEVKANVFTVGDVQIELTEPSWNEDKVNVAPGDTYEKDPTVTNTGKNDAWVRVDVTLTKADLFMAYAESYGIEKLDGIFGGHDEDLWVRVDEPVYDETEKTLTYQYYYTEALASGEATDPLFESVTIPYQFTSTQMATIGEFQIDVVAHAIQTVQESDDMAYDNAVDAFEFYN